MRAIVTSPEFFSAEAARSKVKSPFELAVSAVRALGGEFIVPDPGVPIGRQALMLELTACIKSEVDRRDADAVPPDRTAEGQVQLAVMGRSVTGFRIVLKQPDGGHGP